MSAEYFEFRDCPWCGEEYLPEGPWDLDACPRCKSTCSDCGQKLTKEEIEYHGSCKDSLPMCNDCQRLLK